MIGIVATFRDNGYISPEMKGVLTSVVTKKESKFYESRCDTINAYMKDKGFDPVGFLILTDESMYYSKRLEAGCAELQTYADYHERYINSLKEKGTAEDIIEETEAMLVSHEETLMRMVALRVHSCMTRGIDVTNELAHHCCEWYESIHV